MIIYYSLNYLFTWFDLPFIFIFLLGIYETGGVLVIVPVVIIIFILIYVHILQMVQSGRSSPGSDSRNTILLGAASGVCYAWYGGMANGWVFLAGAALQALQGFLMPGLQGLMTRLVRPEEQEELQGANQSMMGVPDRWTYGLRHGLRLVGPPRV